MRHIKVGQTEANVALIDEGLNAGEQVVVDGQYKLQPGAHVELTSPPPNQPAASPREPTNKPAKR
jgi:multidrug efflux system membrane fusion protein